MSFTLIKPYKENVGLIFCGHNKITSEMIIRKGNILLPWSLWMHLIECIFGKITVNFLGGREEPTLSFNGTKKIEIILRTTCFQQSLIFFGMFIQKNPDKTLNKGRANVWSIWLHSLVPVPKANIIHCHHHPFHWAKRRTIILLFTTGMCYEIKISFYKSPYFLNVFYNAS